MQVLGLVLLVAYHAAVFTAVTSAFWSVWLAYNSPGRLVDMRAEWNSGPSDLQPGMRKYAKAFVVLSMLGYGILVGGGVHSALSWLPLEIGGHDEDGDFTSLRTYIAILAGLIGGLMAGAPVLDYAHIKDDKKRSEASHSAGLPL